MLKLRNCHRLLLGRALFTAQCSTLLVPNISGYTDALRSLVNIADLLPFNPFQSNFSANRILPSTYLLWAGKRLVDYL
jgi:hypothetical protein